ncbi:MAG TPA: CRISPR-associated endonuclease Cas2 [Solirubrobacteraceae bacterium]|nr:CRISPR-associated endonuclease Cas2 [Solirubrobacteraceae bacterium]
MSEAVRRLLVAYDVADDRRRDKVAVALQHHGERVQYSVFMVDGRPAEFVRLQVTLRSLIDPASDRVLLCDLGSRESARRATVYLGRSGQLLADRSALVL